MRARRRGQAIVEFGVIALLFTALMFAVVDFGLLLNTWLSVSSGTRELGRNAAVGKNNAFLLSEAQALGVPSVSINGFAKACCDSTSAIEVKVDYFQGGASPCPPWQSGCTPFLQTQINPAYPFGDLGTLGSSSSCPPPGSPPVATCRPNPDDLVRVTVIAHGAQVITPLIRPAFGCTNGSNPNCNVPLTSQVVLRYEGQEF